MIYGVILPLKGENPLLQQKVTPEGVKLKMTMTVMASRRVFVTNDATQKTRSKRDKVRIITEDQDIIAQFFRDSDGNFRRGLAPYDVVTVAGNLSSLETQRTYTCPVCGRTITKEKGVILYVDPVQIAKEQSITLTQEEKAEIQKQVKKKLAENNIYPSMQDFKQRAMDFYKTKYEDAHMKKATQLLAEHSEMSNLITLIGNVCKEPTFYTGISEKTGKAFSKCTIPLAVTRSRRIEYQEPERQTDYIYVVSYGDDSAQHANCLTVGSQILVRGAIQIREHKQKVFCAECGEVTVDSVDTEVTPYQIEYLKNCILPEGEEDF